jgi:sirohydrochlorin ferrochelatase
VHAATAILLFSHGSVLCGAEQNLLELAARMRSRGDAPIVEVGFLNYTGPTFAQAVARCLEAGARRIVVAPYFLIAGKFVQEDLARTIAEETAEHAGIEFAVADVIGFHESLADAVLASADEARPPRAWRDTMRHASAYCREHPKCPLYGTDVCRIHTGAVA